MNSTRAKIQEQAIKGGWVTVSGKWCTEYGIAGAAATLVRTILRDEKRVLPCSVELDGEYGQQDLFIGVPAVIGKEGVEKVLDLPLTPEEQKQFEACATAIRENVNKAYDIILKEKEKV